MSFMVMRVVRTGRSDPAAPVRDGEDAPLISAAIIDFMFGEWFRASLVMKTVGASRA